MHRIRLTSAGFIVGLLVAFASVTTHRSLAGPHATTTDKLPLGVSQQQLLDAISTDNKLQVVPGQPPNRYVAELNESGATIAIDGPADSPIKATLTTPYGYGSARTAATVARNLAQTIIGDEVQYGEWSAKAIFKCEPGYDVVGECKAAEPNPGVVEVKMKRRVVNGVDIRTVSFGRSK